MKLFDEVEKISNLVIEDLNKTQNVEKRGYIDRSVKMLIEKTIQYEIVAKEMEIQLLTSIPIDKLFKETYKKLENILNSTIKNIKRGVPKLQKKLKTEIIIGVRKNHQEYIKVFKRFENEVNK